MSDQPSPQAPARTLKNLTPHLAKLAFRGFLPMFAGFWRAAREMEGSNPAWADYERLLRACQDILYFAPMHPNEAKQINAEARLNRSLERIATALARIFPTPCGLGELDFYVVTDEVRAHRRQRGLTRWKNAKRRARRRRSR